jgi:Tol biopolymer transport system component
VSFLQKNGTWTKPQSLGVDVNTGDFTETTPFLASDGATLYFSSDRTGGQGSNDIYYTKRID